MPVCLYLYQFVRIGQVATTATARTADAQTPPPVGPHLHRYCFGAVKLFLLFPHLAIILRQPDLPKWFYRCAAQFWATGPDLTIAGGVVVFFFNQWFGWSSIRKTYQEHQIILM